MKTNPKSVLFQLKRLGDDLAVLHNSDARSECLAQIEGLIDSLHRLREGLLNQTLSARAAEIRQPLQAVIDFLAFAKTDPTLAAIVAPSSKTPLRREPIEIPPNLTNEQIRDFLGKELSRAELTLLASQRGISVEKLNVEQIKRRIFENLERLEGYQRLSS